MPWNSGVVTPRLVKTLASGDDFSNPSLIIRIPKEHYPLVNLQKTMENHNFNG